MSRTAEITLPFGSEERRFRLGLGEWRAVQEKTGVGPGVLAQRLAPIVDALQRKVPFSEILRTGAMGAWNVDDVREPLLQGLIGGGMNPTEAGILVRQAFDPRPLDLHNLSVAFAVITEGYLPPEDEPAPAAGEQKAPPKRLRTRRER